MLLLLTLAGGIARADEPPKPPVAPPTTPAPPASAAKPAPPPTPEQAADAVLAAVTAKDDPALKALAAKDAPDPWLVADDLIRRGEFDVADAFATAAPRVDVETLPAYVAARRGKPDDPARRTRLLAAEAALLAKKPQEALDALGPPESPAPRDVVGVLLAVARGEALAGVARGQDAVAQLLAGGEAAEQIGWWAKALGAYAASAASAYRSSALAAALTASERRLAVCERRSDGLGAARTLSNIGKIHYALGDYAKALSAHERALTGMEAAGDPVGVAWALCDMANVWHSRGDYAKALSLYQRAFAAMEERGEKVAAVAILGNIGGVQQALGEHAKALATYEHALADAKALRDKTAAATTLGDMGNVYLSLGDYASALSTYGRALAAKEALGDRRGAALTLGNIGRVHVSLGDYATALAILERALAAKEALGSSAGATTTLADIGNVYYLIGDYAKALSIFQRVLDAAEARGDKRGAANVLGNIGSTYSSLGDFATALATQERALAAEEALGDKAGAAWTMGNIGDLYNSLGDFAKALAILQRALAAKEALGDRPGAATTLGDIGRVHASLGDHAKALAYLERALEAQEALGDRWGAAWTLGNIGSVHHLMGAHGQALAAALRAARAMSSLARGLGAEEGAGARARLAFVFDVGAREAVEEEDAPQLSFFLESGRASALIEGLTARATLWTTAVPEDLRAAEASARAAEAAAMRALRAATGSDDLAVRRARRADLERARDDVAAVVARIQREAKAGASLFYPRVATLEELRATLVAGDAWVLYGVSDQEAHGLVVTADATRIVSLGPTARLEAAVEALSLETVDVEPTTALAALARLIVAPLDLPATTRRVLISPAGGLSFVPFAAMMPGTTVCYVPSGTTYRLLLEEQALRGEGVLALGDPDYETGVDARALAVHRGAPGHLARLPATSDEAGAVGTVTLLRGQATETGLRDALAKRPRWRSVHLACHGLVNRERPALSSLALTAGGADDGFLTCLDVFRMKIPADLAVLSACETGRGKVVKGEGIVGFTRAFMFAGAPRVICSLWKVNDEATKALMVKFYELWSPRDGTPGLPTAEALRQAQEFVRSQEKWKHPCYWAAWVLWGLPD